MPSTTRFADGQWNFTCDLCGATRKSGESTLTWDGRRVCKRHKEVRNPLDLQRPPRPEQAIPWSRPRPPDTFVISNFRLLQENGSQLLQEDGISLLLRT